MPAETPEEKFIRIAERRTNQALDAFRLLSNLKSANYKSSRKQREEILAAIRHGLEELEMCWAGEKPDKNKFSFKKDKVNPDDGIFNEETD
jgi:hypothetical protein